MARCVGRPAPHRPRFLTAVRNDSEGRRVTVEVCEGLKIRGPTPARTSRASARAAPPPGMDSLIGVGNDGDGGRGVGSIEAGAPCPAVQFQGDETRLDRKRSASRMVAWGNSLTERQYNAAGNISGTATLYVYKPSHRHRSGAYPLIFVVEFQFFGRTAGLLEVSLFNWRTRSMTGQ